MIVVLDSDIVTLISYKKNEKLNKRIQHLPQDSELAITIISYMEILQGRFDGIIKAANDTELLVAMDRFNSSRDFLNSFHLLEINAAASKRFTEIIKRKKRQKMNRGGLIIACIALAYSATLITRNVKDYEGVNGLRVENWAD